MSKPWPADLLAEDFLVAAPERAFLPRRRYPAAVSVCSLGPTRLEFPLWPSSAMMSFGRTFCRALLARLTNLLGLVHLARLARRRSSRLRGGFLRRPRLRWNPPACKALAICVYPTVDTLRFECGDDVARANRLADFLGRLSNHFGLRGFATSLSAGLDVSLDAACTLCHRGLLSTRREVFAQSEIL